MMENQPSGEEEKPSSSNAVKKIYGDYEVLKPIGKGKFAIVYRAQKISDQTIVALKRISVDMIDDKAREKCLKEVRLLASLDHPNVIKYMDSFISENDLVIVVEWAAAGDLKRQLRKAQERGVGFEERVIWKYFSQICEAIKHMHEKRVMHRDLKPANIFLTLDGTVKVGDLGLSRELSEHTVQAHSKVGTPLYMSPEVLRGDGYDFKSDIWSLGCLLYELAMLKSPFKAEGLNLYGLFQKISAGDFTAVPDNYSVELRSLVNSMLSNKSEDRPEIAAVCVTASAMREKLARKRSVSSTNAGANSNSTSVANPQIGDSEQQAPEAKFKDDQSYNRDRVDSNRSTSHGASTVKNDNTRSEAKEYETEVKRGSNNNWDMHGNGSIEPNYGIGDNDNVQDRYLSNYQQNQRSNSNHFEDDEMVRIPSGSNENVVVGPAPDEMDRMGRYIGNNDVKEERPDIHMNSHMPRQSGNGYSRPDSASRNGRNMNSQSKMSRVQPEKHFRHDISSSSTAEGDENLMTVGVDNGNGSGHGTNFPDVPANTKEKSYNATKEYGDKNEKKNSSGGGFRDTKPSGNKIGGKASDHMNGWDFAGDDRKEPSNNGFGSNNQFENEPYRELQRNEVSRGESRKTSGRDRVVQDRSRNNSRGNEPNERKPTKMATKTCDKSVMESDFNSTTRVTRNGGEVNYQTMVATSELMELLYVKLVLLRYPFKGEQQSNARMVLTPLHFLCDLSILGGSGNIDTSSQFSRFVEVSIWILDQLGQSHLTATWNVDDDTPVMLAKQVLYAAQACGVGIADMTPSSLIPGNGEKVCRLLNELADCLLKKRSYTFRKPDYSSVSDGAMSHAQEYEDASEEEIEDPEFDVEDDTDVLFDQSMVSVGQTGKDHGGSTSMVGGGSMIFTTADPTLWKEEASRVSSRLVAAGNERLHRVHGMVIGSDSSWVSHYEVLKDFAIKNNLMGSADRNKTEENVEMISEIHGGIKSLVRENNTQLSSIKRTEASLANSSSLQIHSVIFGEIKRGLTSTEAHVAVLTKSLEEKSAELSEIEDLLEVVGEKYNERTGGGGGGGEDSHGTGGLVKVKTALRLLKEELAELELREGMTSNELLNLRKQQNVLNLEKQHQRRRKGKYHKTGSVSELDD